MGLVQTQADLACSVCTPCSIAKFGPCPPMVMWPHGIAFAITNIEVEYLLGNEPSLVILIDPVGAFEALHRQGMAHPPQTKCCYLLSGI